MLPSPPASQRKVQYDEDVTNANGGESSTDGRQVAPHTPDAQATSLVKSPATPATSPAAVEAAPVDIDAPYQKDPQACTSYVCDIYRNLRLSECRGRPSTCYIEKLQGELNASMRSMLVDWLVEVSFEWQLVPETLFLAVSYLDRYLSKVPVQQQALQLVGTACLLIASKYEEIYTQPLQEYRFMTDNTYSARQILACERDILAALEYDISIPTIYPFFRRFSRAAQSDAKQRFLSLYLSELSLLEYGMLAFLPSQIAATSTLLAQIYLHLPLWSCTLCYYSGYSKAELRACAKALHHCFLNSKRANVAITLKYSEHRYMCVANVSTDYVTLPDHLFS